MQVASHNGHMFDSKKSQYQVPSDYIFGTIFNTEGIKPD